MSLTKEQRKELELLAGHLEKIEKTAIENNIDLDVFISEYNEEGYSVYATEKVSMEERGSKRKEVFQTGARTKSARQTQKSK